MKKHTKINWPGIYFRTKRLLPCPFRGGEAGMLPQNYGWLIKCMICNGNKLSFSFFFDKTY